VTDDTPTASELISGDDRGRPPETIGPYRLRSTLGEGGFGIVYLAEQTGPVRRRVALKVIKPGMDSRAVIARFEAERQALAMMDHPCVATVLDAGATDRGLPYFVMELVEGEPITSFCDRHRLSVRDRVELFIRICDAVQHAHTKGVIHRDIKPSNILVTYDGDGRAQPKVIDFGVAKALHQPLTEATVFTQQGQLVGTPEYMSPEQAEMSATGIDTRADVYSLGVLLYELLTGLRPFDLQRAALAEMQRVIRETEPPKPSTRLSTLVGSAAHAEAITRIANARHTDARSLPRSLRGDLDWVIMRCLEKDRERRYDTANALGMELRRYLEDEPVLAGPPSAGYRIGKFVKRNRAGVVSAIALSVALLLGLIGTTLALLEANHQRRLAIQRAADLANERKLATSRLADAVTLLPADSSVLVDGEHLAVNHYAWQLRASIDETDTIAAYRNLAALVSAGEEVSAETRERFLPLVPEAIERLRQMSWNTAAFEHLDIVRPHYYVDRDEAWYLGIRLCDAMLSRPSLREEERVRYWIHKSEFACESQGSGLNGDQFRFDLMSEFARWALEAGHPDIVLTSADCLRRLAADSTSMGRGGPWPTALVDSLLAKARWLSGDRYEGETAARAQLVALSRWEEHGVYIGNAMYAADVLLFMLRDSGRGDGDLALLLEQIDSTESADLIQVLRESEDELRHLLESTPDVDSRLIDDG
jgi:serine/threonine protein kinase